MTYIILIFSSGYIESVSRIVRLSFVSVRVFRFVFVIVFVTPCHHLSAASSLFRPPLPRPSVVFVARPSFRRIRRQ